MVTSPWADGIAGIDCGDMHVDGCTVVGGRDVGITLQNGTGDHLVRKNVIRYAGTAGIFAGTPRVRVEGNTIEGGNTVSTDELGYGALQVEDAHGAQVRDNRVTSGGAPYDTRAIVVDGIRGDCTEVRFSGNTYSGFSRTDVLLRGPQASCSGTFAPNTRTEVEQGAQAPDGSFSGAADPEGKLIAANGATYRTTGSNPATWRKTGDGATGWVKDNR